MGKGDELVERFELLRGGESVDIAYMGELLDIRVPRVAIEEFVKALVVMNVMSEELVEMWMILQRGMSTDFLEVG